jgi:cytochrome c-type biogenesis protein CcmF
MLKLWNVSLVLATGILAIMGTFLVRSGVLSSIHAFGASTLGVPFVVLIGVLVASSVGLVVGRRYLLRSEHRLDSLLSREAVFMANNVVLVGLCFVIFWGTYFPLISEAITGSKASVGPPWFDRYTVPLALVLVLLSGIGPVMAWRRASAAHARRNFAVPVLAALATLAALAGAGLGSRPGAVAMFCCAAFVAAAVGQEFWRGVRARMAMGSGPAPAALIALVRRNRRRYGGYIVHVGIAVLFVGVAASSSFRHESEVSLRPGQSTQLGPYQVRYVRPTAHITPPNDPSHTGAVLDIGATLDVSRRGRHVATRNPSRGYYESRDPSQGSVGHLIGGEPVSHVGLTAGPLRDFWSAIEPNLSTAELQRYVILGNRKIPFVRPDEGGIVIAFMARDYLQHPPPAQFHFLASPLVTWIWLGGLIVFGGGLVALWPSPALVRRRVRSPYAARVARGLGRA